MIDTSKYQAQSNELSQKLWAISNELRGQMDASEFKNYILGVIFYRYLSERTEMYMADILENDGLTYEEAFADEEFRPVVEEWSLSKLGYVIKPEYLFRNLIRKIKKFENEADKSSCYRLTEVLYLTTVKNKTEGVFVWDMNPIKHLMDCLMICVCRILVWGLPFLIEQI